jgi:hypothetical protein
MAKYNAAMLNTYSGGVADKEKPLLNVEQLTRNSSGLGRYVRWIASENSMSFCRCFLLAGAGYVHDIGGIPL